MTEERKRNEEAIKRAVDRTQVTVLTKMEDIAKVTHVTVIIIIISYTIPIVKGGYKSTSTYEFRSFLIWS